MQHSTLDHDLFLPDRSQFILYQSIPNSVVSIVTKLRCRWQWSCGLILAGQATLLYSTATIPDLESTQPSIE